MANVTPVLPHIALTMDVEEAAIIVLGLDTLHAWAEDDVPEAIVAFAKTLGSAVEKLTDHLAGEDVNVDDGLAAA